MTDNPPAFPCVVEREVEPGCYRGKDIQHLGATMRDLYAMAALIGRLSERQAIDTNSGIYSRLATDCFDIAEKMLIERAKR